METLLEIEPSRSGAMTLVVNKKYVHSRFDPIKEAITFFRSIPHEEHGAGRIWFLINPGLGYLAQVIGEELAGQEVYQLFSHPVEKIIPYIHGEFWAPDSASSLEDFINQASNGGIHRDKIHILVWRPGFDSCPQSARELLGDIKHVLSRLQADSHTLKYFSRIWMRNCLDNILRTNFSALPKDPCNFPVLLVAAGPSLEEHMGFIADNQSRFFVVALSSALRPLLTRGISPDLVMQSDGGYWAKYHSALIPNASLVLSALRSKHWHPSHEAAIFPFACSQIDQFIWSLFYNTPLPSYGDQGTVAFQALQFCLARFSNAIIIVGLDFARRDMQSHARPHTFDHFSTENESRINPSYSKLYKQFADAIPLPVGLGSTWYSDHNLRLFSDNFFNHFHGNNRIFQLGPQELLRFPPWETSTSGAPLDKLSFTSSCTKMAPCPDYKSPKARALENIRTVFDRCKAASYPTAAISAIINELPETVPKSWDISERFMDFLTELRLEIER